MNVLLLGKADSVFTRDFCRYILDSDEMNTVILSQELSEEYKHDYGRCKADKVAGWVLKRSS